MANTDLGRRLHTRAASPMLQRETRYRVFLTHVGPTFTLLARFQLRYRTVHMHPQQGSFE